MTTLVDASLIVAILGAEPDAIDLASSLRDADMPISSAASIWEATVILARKLDRTIAVASHMVSDLVHAADIRLIDIGEREAERAIAAFERYGNGRHRAQLNMGDCFSYAWAKTHGARLLHKGADFAGTDFA